MAGYSMNDSDTDDDESVDIQGGYTGDLCTPCQYCGREREGDDVHRSIYYCITGISHCLCRDCMRAFVILQNRLRECLVCEGRTKEDTLETNGTPEPKWPSEADPGSSWKRVDGTPEHTPSMGRKSIKPKSRPPRLNLPPMMGGKQRVERVKRQPTGPY